jgi:hypothetical protein
MPIRRHPRHAKRCIVCDKPYYRRNLTIIWTYVAGEWSESVAKGHPGCLSIYTKVAKLFVAQRAEGARR